MAGSCGWCDIHAVSLVTFLYADGILVEEVTLTNDRKTVRLSMSIVAGSFHMKSTKKRPKCS